MDKLTQNPHTTANNAASYAIASHMNTNHFYDTYIPYEFHLRLVVVTADKFLHLVPEDKRAEVLMACWCHDLIEDARQSYSDVKNNTTEFAAEIVRACTNYGRGRNRKERMPDDVYHDINTVPYAKFVKLCDRIANAQYSKMMRSPQFDMYVKEQAHFEKKLWTNSEFTEMWNCLNDILNSKN